MSSCRPAYIWCPLCPVLGRLLVILLFSSTLLPSSSFFFVFWVLFGFCYHRFVLSRLLFSILQRFWGALWFKLQFCPIDLNTSAVYFNYIGSCFFVNSALFSIVQQYWGTQQFKIQLLNCLKHFSSCFSTLFLADVAVVFSSFGSCFCQLRSCFRLSNSNELDNVLNFRCSTVPQSS